MNASLLAPGRGVLFPLYSTRVRVGPVKKAVVTPSGLLPDCLRAVIEPQPHAQLVKPWASRAGVGAVEDGATL
jgi:hypothetical protein